MADYAKQNRFLSGLVKGISGLESIHSEHEIYHGEVLSYILLADITRWIEASVNDKQEITDCQTVLDRIEFGLAGGGDDVVDLILQSFIDALVQSADFVNTPLYSLLGPFCKSCVLEVIRRAWG